MINLLTVLLTTCVLVIIFLAGIVLFTLLAVGIARLIELIQASYDKLINRVERND